MKKNRNKKIILSLILLGLAESTSAITFADAAKKLSNGIIHDLSMLAFLVGFVFFLWGIFLFVLNEAGSSKRQEGLNKIIYSVIVLFIMFSFWGVVKFFTNSLELDNRHIEIKLNGGKSYTGNSDNTWTNTDSSSSGSGGVNYGENRLNIR